jgi:ribokinase
MAQGLLTGTAVILVDPTGQNSIVTHAGPNVLLTEDDIRRAIPAIKRADIFLSTLEVHAAPLFEAFRAARAAGVRTILNPAPPVDFPHELLELVDICLPNESELAALTGCPLDDVRTSAELLRRKGPKAVVVTMGERGAFILDGAGAEMVTGLSVKAVDSSGAGDSFAASLAVALGEGKSLRDAARWANVVASVSVTRPGTQASFPKRNQLES